MAKKPQQSELDNVDPIDPSVQLNERGELVKVCPSGPLTLRQDAPQEEWPTSLQVGTPRWKAAIVNSATTPDLNIGAEWSEPYMVTDWLVMWREGVDEKTGEISRYPWLSLICADGSIIGTSSAVVPHQIARMLRSYTSEEWAAGIPVRIRRRMNRAGNRSYHELRVSL